MNKINSYVSGYYHSYEQFQQNIIIIYISVYIEKYKYYNNGVTPKGVGLSGSDILLRNTRLQSLTQQRIG